MAMFQARGQGLLQDGAQANSPTLKAKSQAKHSDHDFIILSEFSEQVGPVPIQFIPEDGNKPLFDASQFSVRIMTSDYQSPSGKLAGEDTQVLLSEKMDNIFAYVHYFSLNDINARGYVRQYCFSYITSKFYKLVDNFTSLKEKFCEVTAMLKCGNQRVFKRDLEHHLADLTHTKDEIKSEGFDNVDGLDNAQLYLGYDFTIEDVPERDPRQVDSAMQDTTEILTLLKEQMVHENNQSTWKSIKGFIHQQKNQFILQPLKDKFNNSPSLRRADKLKLGSPDSEGPDMSQNVFVDSLELTSSTSSERAPYQPQRVMTHTVHKFERRLRSLKELTLKAHPAAMEKLQAIHKFFSRSEVTLEVEKEEIPLLNPRSSLLSIGRVPMVNFLQNFSHFLSNTPSHLLQPQPYCISCKNTWGQPSEAHTFHKDITGLPSQFINKSVDKPVERESGFDTSFMSESSSLIKCPLYIDLSHYNHSSRFSSTTSYLSNSFNQLALNRPLVQVRESSSESQHLIPVREKRASDLGPEDDRGSPSYHTPVTGLTPSSSSEEGRGTEGMWRDTESPEKLTPRFHIDSNKSTKLDSDDESTQNRTPSLQSFSSAVDMAGSSQSLHSELFGGKPRPIITSSDITAQGRVSSRSRSLSPPDQAHGLNSKEACASTDALSPVLENWGSSKKTNIGSKQELMNLSKEYTDEESHSAGSGRFNSSPLHKDHDHFQVQSKIVAESISQDQLHKMTNGHPRIMKEYLPVAATEKTKKPSQLPRQLSAAGTVSPERYYSPMGEPPEMFGSDPTSSLLSPGKQSLISIVSVSPSVYRGPSVVEIFGNGRLPLVSSVDLVECEVKFKPGRGLLTLWKDNPSIKDLIYCLLHGRPLAIIGKQSDENIIRRFVRLLWIFIPGHSSKQQIITWQENPLNVKDLSRVKLIGMSHTSLNNMGPHLQRCISQWDISTGKMNTPPYNGELLKPILSRTRNAKNEQAFLALTLSVLLGISMKAYVYYHSYRTSRQAGGGETAAKVYHSVLQRLDSPQRQRCLFLQNHLGVRGSDVDILEYLCDIIREQQLTEWRDDAPEGTPQNDEPVTFKLHIKQCRETTHKPKRPY